MFWYEFVHAFTMEIAATDAKHYQFHSFVRSQKFNIVGNIALIDGLVKSTPVVIQIMRCLETHLHILRETIFGKDKAQVGFESR